MFKNSGESSPEVPEGLMRKCNACRAVVLAESIIGNQYICPKCGNYFSVPARRRIEMLADEESFKEWDTGLTSGNPLHYKGYEDKVEALREKTGLDEAVTTGLARIGGHEVVLAVCDSHFMMASMGKVVGEKLTRAIEKATERKVAGDYCCLLRRGQNAGRYPFSDADGENICRLKKTS